MSMLDEEDIKLIEKSVKRAMEFNNYGIKDHDSDHAFIKVLREREKNKEKLRNAIKIHIAKWGSVGLLTGLLAAIWTYIKQHV